MHLCCWMITSSPTRPGVAPQSCTAPRTGYWVAERAFQVDSCDSDCWGAAKGKVTCLQTSRTSRSHLAAPYWTSWSLLWCACGHCGPGLGCTVLQSNRQSSTDHDIDTWDVLWQVRADQNFFFLNYLLTAVRSRNCTFEAKIVDCVGYIVDNS